MATMNSEPVADWVTAVADEAELPREYVEDTLTALGIHATPHLPTPHHIRIVRLVMTGEKHIGGAAHAFDFSYELRTGVQAIASEDNGVGKSSVLLLMLGLLRGSLDRLQADVRNWLRTACLEFMVDDVQHALHVGFRDGHPNGSLTRESPEGSVQVANFESKAGFAEAMNAFMLDALALERLPSWQARAGEQDEGQVITHGWQAYAGALVVAGASHEVLLGEVAMGGLPGRLLQMFVGVPWASTVAQAKTCKREVHQSRQRDARRLETENKARQAGEASLRDLLDNARNRLQRIPDDTAIQSGLQAAMAQVADRYSALLVANGRAYEIESTLELARRVVLEDKKRKMDLEEAEATRRFFGGLDPSCCPRCDAGIGPDRRKAEQDRAVCSVCARPVVEEELPDDAAAKALTSLAASEKAEAAAKQLVAMAAREVEALKEALDAAKASHSALEAQATRTSQRRIIEIEVAKLEGALGEREGTRAALLTKVSNEGVDREQVVVDAAIKVAEERVKLAASATFLELDEEILRLAHAFGLSALEQVKLDRAGRLAVKKGGVQTYFSHLTSGERLRLRVATIVGMLRIAQRRTVGRHPGLLVIDSPGAEEARTNDAAELIQELCRLAGEMPNLQIVVGTARPELVQNALPTERLRLVPRGEKLW